MQRRRVLQAGISAALLASLHDARADNHDGALCGASTPLDHVEVLWGPNHGHVLVVPADHLVTPAARTYEIAGKSDHSHAFSVTADDFSRLSRGEDVRLASTKTGGHIHRVRLRAAPAVLPPEWVTACEVLVGGNDGHELVVTRADLEAKRERTYDIRGVAPHTHALVLGASHFADLLAGKLVHVTTGPGDAHTHVVAIHPPKKA